MRTCEVRCLNCGQLFESPIQFGDETEYEMWAIASNTVQCPHCESYTGCSKRNMIFHADNEGLVGRV